MTATENRQDKSWLVKSSTRILGPFTSDEVGQLLLKKHISIIDEVRLPDGRWRYIREHKIFDEVVQALRDEQEKNPDHTQTQTSTQTSTHSNTYGSGISSVTKTDTGILQNDDLTPTPTPAPITVRSDLSLPAMKTQMKDIQPFKETDHSGNALGPRSYGLPADSRFRNQVTDFQKKFRLLLTGVAIAIVIILGAAQWHKVWKKQQGYDSLIEEALRARNLQLYEKSLQAYHKAAQIHEPSNEVQEQMALVLVVFDRQNIWGRRIFEKEIQEEKGNRSRVTDAHLGIAISHVLEGSLKEGEDALQKVLILEPNNFNALLNLSLIEIRKGNWKEADRQLVELSRRSPPHPLVLLARGIALLESSGWHDQARAQDLVAEIRTLSSHTQQLRPELLLISAALMPPSEGPGANLVNAFLAEVIQPSNLFARDLRLDWRVADWDSLDKYCRDYVDHAPASAHTKALRAVCLSLAGRETESRQFLSEALAEGPKDPFVLFTQANLLAKNGMRNEATAVLRLPETASVFSKNILAGKVCLEDGNLSCAEKSFRLVLSSGQRPVSVLAGLADVLQREDRKAESADLIREGLEIEPGYLPFVILRENAEGNP